MEQPPLLLQEQHVSLATREGRALGAYALHAKVQVPAVERLLAHVSVAVRLLRPTLVHSTVATAGCAGLVQRRLPEALRAVLTWVRRLSWQQSGHVVEGGVAEGTPLQTLPRVAAAAAAPLGCLCHVRTHACLAKHMPPTWKVSFLYLDSP